jgi:hypothetical protein
MTVLASLLGMTVIALLLKGNSRRHEECRRLRVYET